MLQSLSIKPTRPVFREHREASPRATKPGIEITATADAKKPVCATINVFAAAFDSTEQASPIGTSLINAAAFNCPEDAAATDSAPAYSIRTDLGALRKLRSKLEKCVTAHARHCPQCQVVAHYLSVCWERPRLLHRTWDGAAALQMEPLASFLNQLLLFACQLNATGNLSDEGDDAHQEFVRLLVAFLHPSH
jgi:hypothetical protein